MRNLLRITIQSYRAVEQSRMADGSVWCYQSWSDSSGGLWVGEDPFFLTQSYFLTCPAYRFRWEEYLRDDPGGHCLVQPSDNLVTFYMDISWIKA